jgi:uncharacterized protein YfaS (alpha-2-macroglobulin family)
MNTLRGALVLAAVLALLLLPQQQIVRGQLYPPQTVTVAAPAPAAPAKSGDAQALMSAGNWKDAYDVLAKRALDPADDPQRVPSDLTEAIRCLYRLGRQNEVDALRENVIGVHAKNWRLLYAAAQSYMSGEHNGYMVAGKFNRGYSRRGADQYANAYERDRVRALQLMETAMPLADADGDRRAVADFYWNLANSLNGFYGWNAWTLQVLTDTAVLPDYDDSYWRGGRGESRGAPVNQDGSPVLYSVPDSWKNAVNDGERWRWALQQVTAADPNRWGQVTMHLANFLRGQFGVQTMQQYGWFMRSQDNGQKDEAGPYNLFTLRDEETICRLATGIKRITLPDEFNYIALYQQVAAREGDMRLNAVTTLANCFEDRRQYERAARLWLQAKALAERNPQEAKQYQARFDQIMLPWGTFETTMTQPAGKGAVLGFRYRNGRKLSVTARRIDIDALLGDLKALVKSNPKQIDWWQLNIGDLGYRLVQQNQTKYLKDTAAEWDVTLTPRENHFDRRVDVKTPLKDAGAYLVTAQLAGGNVSRLIVWVADTAIVKKPLDKSILYYVADAVSGKPISGASLEFFGYRNEWVDDKNGRGHNEFRSAEFNKTTDTNGQVFTSVQEQSDNHNWLITARAGDRLAYLGFTGVWYPAYYDEQYNETKVFLITDRPVYRPEQTVQFKFWVNQAKYDQEGNSPNAGQSFTVRIYNPKGEKVYEKTLKADNYGGLSDSFAPGKTAMLGEYSIYLQQVNNSVSGGGSFRLEEYKKPEFEVKVEAPTEPVMLGETVIATIKANYLFGAPVTHAKVKYKVMRTSYAASWYPQGRWDWLYGHGYWWYACDYAWYPGWRDWGCVRPMPIWYQGWSREQPEIVAESETPVGADGTVKVAIDTALAKRMLGDSDHRYEITAEVTDQSRRTIVGQGSVLVARKPFKVYAWVDRGHYRVGDPVTAAFSAQTLDGRPVEGVGDLRLLRVSYKKGADGELAPVETEVQRWALNPKADGTARLQLKASEAGQYRLSYKVTDTAKHAIEGGYVFYVRGEGNDGSGYRFNDLELTTDRREYQPGDTANLLISTNRDDAVVLLFVRAANGICLPSKVLRLNGKNVVEPIEVLKKDMPNFFVEAVTVSNGHVYNEIREIVVPPEKRALNVTVTPAAGRLRPGQPNTVKVKVTDNFGKPYSGQAVVTMYDRAVEYISGGSNVPEIKEFFWKWRRNHNPTVEHSLQRGSGNIQKGGEVGMSYLGAFGYALADEESQQRWDYDRGTVMKHSLARAMPMSVMSANGAVALDAAAPMTPPAPMMSMAKSEMAADGRMREDGSDKARASGGGGGAPEEAMVQPTVRTNFADTALWVAAIQTNANGEATIPVTMPDSLTTWKTRVWVMGDGARVGEGTTEVVTGKNVMVRLQAPRFFVQKDEVIISANVHNYLTSAKTVNVALELEGNTLALEPGLAKAQLAAKIASYGEQRVDWRVKVLQPGLATVRVKALTSEESDAMQMTFPVYVHGMLKTESFSGAIRPDGTQAEVKLRVPNERLPEYSSLVVRYSPTLAGAMVDALPYLVEYPYNGSDMSLNRFLPTVLTQSVLKRMGVSLKDIRDKRANLNAQEVGDAKTRAADWKRITQDSWGQDHNPVFDEAEVANMVRDGMGRLESMQCADGGWGWFSGFGERSYPHTTALVVHGLQVARASGAAVNEGVIQRGLGWLKTYQNEQIAALRRWDAKQDYGKARADAMDAFVYMVLVDEKIADTTMRDYLYRDRADLPVYAKSMFALALHHSGDTERRDALLHNIEQYLVQDDENQTAYLKLPDSGWWYWYGSEFEAQAYYLKLLAAVKPQSETASRLAKYLINNRKHATYWNSTRDTAIVIEALSDYIKASGEDAPDMTVEIRLDGRTVKQTKIDKGNLFAFDGTLVLMGAPLTSGQHTVSVVKRGTGPVYFNAYLTNFTLEDMITKAGLEIKVERNFFKLVPVKKTVKAAGVGGRPIDQQVEKFERVPLANLATVKSGDLVEVELNVDAKNDYEYLVFEDMKAAGFEPEEVRSGYGNNGLGAYMELRDERVCFFVRALPRGPHTITYRLRAEVPGQFSALPTRATAIYAPELRANSDEIKLRIED